MKEYLFLSSPHMGGKEQFYIQLAFDTNWISPLGANVTGFEADLTAYTQSPFVTVLSAGTAALHLALILAGIKQGDKVFCQSLTFSASANPIVYCGATPIFIDSEAETWNLDPALLEEAVLIHGIPKALVVVHLYGMPAKMDEIVSFCEKYHVTLIEDAAEGLGGEYHGQKLGTLGNFGALSFNGNKIITTSGGGALLSKTKEHADRALKLATQAREPFPWYQHEEIGYNYRLSNVSAGIGRGQMEVLENRIAKKREIFSIYQQELASLPLSFGKELPDTVSNRWLSVALLESGCGITPAHVIEVLNRENIESRHLWKPMHLQPIFKDAPHVGGAVSEGLFSRGVCLPSDTKMTREQQLEVCQTLKEIF